MLFFFGFRRFRVALRVHGSGVQFDFLNFRHLDSRGEAFSARAVATPLEKVGAVVPGTFTRSPPLSARPTKSSTTTRTSLARAAGVVPGSVSILESTNVIEVITTVASVSRPRLGRVVKLQRLPAKVDLSQVSCSLVDLLSTRLQLTRSRQL